MLAQIRDRNHSDEGSWVRGNIAGSGYIRWWITIKLVLIKV